MMAPRILPPLLVAVAAGLGGCREGTVGIPGAVPITPSTAGNHGCNAPNLAFTPPTAIGDAALNALVGPLSQIAAPAGSETLYMTGADGSIHELDVSTVPVTPNELVSGAAFDAALAAYGIGGAEPSALAVVDGAFLLVADNASNTLWVVDRVSGALQLFAGRPDPSGGFSPSVGAGFGAAVRFNFSEAAMIAPSAIVDNRIEIFVADVGNHAVRRIRFGVGLLLPPVQTIAGQGFPFYRDGALSTSGFDTPVGMVVGCDGRLLIVEAGGGTAGAGHRLRSMGIGDPDPFGFLAGDVTTLAGDGVDQTTEGVGTAASLASPRGLASSTEGEVYWVDSSTGTLRRHSLTTGLTDCPLVPNCTGPGSFMPGPGFSLAITEAVAGTGRLYVLDGNAGELFRVTL